jgi:hypothetical protein
MAWEFYDLKRDPRELINRYGDVDYKTIIAEMKRELARQRQELNDTDAKYPEIKKIIEENWNKKNSDDLPSNDFLFYCSDSSSLHWPSRNINSTIRLLYFYFYINITLRC